ncbi:MAG: exodeoxyribonuclease V subunit alpha [Gammaproteobacteria bacterium]
MNGARKTAFENLVLRVSSELSQGHNCIAVTDSDRELLLQSGLAGTAGRMTSPLPLVVEENRLYLYRYWFYENRLAQRIREMTGSYHPDSDLDSRLERYFANSQEAVDWQREAAKMALSRTFSLITGGPGTGKTTTVVKILALLQELSPMPLQIALAAPTGKAAMRLQEAIAQHKAALPCSDEIRQWIPEEVSTLHRLLGAMPPSPYFRHNAEKPLIHDLVVVDEASMIDLALMSKLADALKPNARLILLGDKDQLASIESGAVLADLTRALPEHTVELITTHRFDADIKKLAAFVNGQQDQAAWQVFQEGNENISIAGGDPVDYIASMQAPYLRLVAEGADFAEISRAHARFQALCANKEGRNSVSDINHRVEQKLFRDKLIRPTGSWYAGRPVMITQNNPALHLYNGDIGICLPDKEEGGKLAVFFRRSGDDFKKYSPGRITRCEMAFAMTIHKSQGSEFEEVLILLPGEVNPILTKELLYTAITRAQKTVKLAAGETVFRAAVRQKIDRVTGLIAKLSQGNVE